LLGTSRPKRQSEGKTYKDESGFTEKNTAWHRVTCFNRLGRVVAQHAVKGIPITSLARFLESRRNAPS
jgi:single-strand DNA-binding protein